MRNGHGFPLAFFSIAEKENVPCPKDVRRSLRRRRRRERILPIAHCSSPILNCSREPAETTRNAPGAGVPFRPRTRRLLWRSFLPRRGAAENKGTFDEKWWSFARKSTVFIGLFPCFSSHRHRVLSTVCDFFLPYVGFQIFFCVFLF